MAKDRKKTQGKPKGRPTPAVPAEEGMSLARSIAWWSLLAMVFMVPIAMSNMTWLGFRMPLTYDQFDIIKVFFQRVFGLIALAAWGWDILSRGGKIRRTPVDWLILAFLVWVAISAVFSISPWTALFGKYRRFEGLFSFINYAVIYFLVLQFADRPSRVRSLAKTLFWSGFIVAGYGVMQSLGTDPVHWGQLPFEANRAFSTYGNPDLLGGFLMFSVPITLGLVLSEDKLWMRLVYWIGFALNMWCLIVAFTRGAWIGALVSVPLVTIIAFRHRAQFFKIDWVPVGAISALSLGIIFESLKNPNSVMNFAARFASIFDFRGGSGGTRTEIWSAAIKAVEARPIFGFGADTFRLVFPKYKPVQYVADAGYRSVADNVHDYPLQLSAGIGIFGMLMFYGICVWAAIRSAPLVFKRSDDHRRILFGAFWAACAGYLVQLMFGLSVTGNTFLLWAALGVVLAPTATVVEFKPPTWGLAVAVVGMVLAGLGIGYQIVYMQADRAYLVAMVASQGQERVLATQRAVQLNPFNDMYLAEVGVAYRDLMIADLNAAQQAQASGQDPQQYITASKSAYDSSVQALNRTIAFVPWEYDNYVFLASIHNIAGQTLNPAAYKDALAVAKQGSAVEQYGPAILVEMARAYNGLGDNPNAIAAAKKAADMDPNDIDAWMYLSSLYEGAGNKAQALAVLKTYDAHMPGDSNVAAAIKRLEPSSTTPPTK